MKDVVKPPTRGEVYGEKLTITYLKLTRRGSIDYADEIFVVSGYTNSSPHPPSAHTPSKIDKVSSIV